MNCGTTTRVSCIIPQFWICHAIRDVIFVFDGLQEQRRKWRETGTVWTHDYLVSLSAAAKNMCSLA